MILINGQRVELFRGDRDPNEDSGYRSIVAWIAGYVPVGSKGTVHKMTEPFIHFQIIWDDPKLKAKGGYFYMVTADIDDFIKEI
ncbi:MAG: hypothetical protein DRH26_00545 [Deltaproteobacteria bacterium]|nr:MAG: hypothetical protein DRH26_00545 [Deltaproteobacteria bacterium]